MYTTVRTCTCVWVDKCTRLVVSFRLLWTMNMISGGCSLTYSVHVRICPVIVQYVCVYMYRSMFTSYAMACNKLASRPKYKVQSYSSLGVENLPVNCYPCAAVQHTRSHVRVQIFTWKTNLESSSQFTLCRKAAKNSKLISECLNTMRYGKFKTL